MLQAQPPVCSEVRKFDGALKCQQHLRPAAGRNRSTTSTDRTTCPLVPGREL